MLEKFPTLARLISDVSPFVVRAFRGGRLKRYAVLNIVLVVLTVLGGTWLALGSGSMERDFREEIGVERPYWDRQQLEFTNIVTDDFEYATLAAERGRLWAENARPYDTHEMQRYSLSWMIRDAHALSLAALVGPIPPRNRQLAEQVEEMLLRHRGPADREDYGSPYFSWDDPRSVERLTSIVEADMLPHVELYRSPLDATGAGRVVGAIAGFFALVLLLVIGPLLSGAQIAQEAHENTLPPLLGTRLSPRSLVLGLTAGAMGVALFFAVPQLLIFAVAAGLFGNTLAGIGFVVALATAAAVLVMLTQMMGLAMGRRWASGLVGITLCGALGMAMFAGAGFGWNITDDTAGMITLLPHAGPSYLMRAAFFTTERLSPTDLMFIDARLMFSTLSFGLLALVATRALQRRIANRTQSSITRAEGFVAATVVAGLAVMAMPEFDGSDAVAVYFLSLGAAMLPLAALLAGRVAVGDGPANTRVLPLRSLLSEFAGFVGIHAGIALFATQFEMPFSFVGFLFLAWTLSVVAMVAIRATAMPLRLASALFCLFALFAAGVQFVLAGAAFETARHSGFSGEGLTELFELSPLLGLTQVVVLFAVPLLLVRAVRKGSAGLR